MWKIIEGDCVDSMAALDAGTVQTCVTSPPYYGLRDYGTGEWEGGDEACEHSQGRPGAGRADGVVDGRAQRNRDGVGAMGGDCKLCGARRVDQQIGLEASPAEYVAKLVNVFREVRRVLRDDGTVWLNLGDSYASGGSGPPSGSSTLRGNGHVGGGPQRQNLPNVTRAGKPKDLLGIPWRVAFALRDDGWYLRADIVWSKPNPMPESVTDRPTKAHEYVFLLSKQPRYLYDADAIREGAVSDHPSGNGYARQERETYKNANGSARGQAAGWTDVGGMRNKRSVWTVATQPFPGAHFAVFPPKLIEPCILAGSAERACGECGAPWKRVVDRECSGESLHVVDRVLRPREGQGTQRLGPRVADSRQTLSFEPSCDHNNGDGSSTVLDPFAGSGTTGLVALRHGRSFIGCELSAEYAQMARDRIMDDAPLLNMTTAVVEHNADLEPVQAPPAPLYQDSDFA